MHAKWNARKLACTAPAGANNSASANLYDLLPGKQPPECKFRRLFALGLLAACWALHAGCARLLPPYATSPVSSPPDCQRSTHGGAQRPAMAVALVGFGHR